MNKTLGQRLKSYGPGFMFILPALLFIILFIAYPVIQSLILSFFKWQGYGPWEFVGIKNYIKLFTSDRVFIQSLTNSFIYSFAASIGTVFVGLVIAIIIHLKAPAWKIYRVLFVLPIILMQVAVSLMYTRVLAPEGLFNTVLEFLNLGFLQRAWLGDPNTALPALILITIWQYSGSPMIFLLAGLQNIDEEIYEAAKIDGASTIRRIFSITIPMLRNVLSVVFLLQMIFTFKAFDLVWFLTRGGPANTTEVLAIRLYYLGFASRRIGPASVISVVMVVIAIIFSILYIRFTGYGRKRTL